jgi:hypothetical protein
VEVEQQGAYAELAPGASSAWTVHWFLRKLPVELDAAPGSTALASFARELAALVAPADATSAEP